MADQETGLIRRREPSKRCKIIGVSCAVFTLILIIILIAALSKTDKPSNNDPVTSEAFEGAVAAAFPKILSTVTAFMNIALDNNGSRAVALGYNDSAEHVFGRLVDAGYTVERQPLVVPVWTELSQPSLSIPSRGISFVWQTDFMGSRYGGNCSDHCSVTAAVVDVPNFGCNATDYNATLTGAIAVITAGGGCEFFQKAMFCEEVGCAAILFRSLTGTLSNNRVRKTGWLGGDPLINLPCLSVTATTAKTLLSFNDTVTLNVHADLSMHDTFNIFATTAEGNPNKTIVCGSHLDSVPEGPGINDNGSGSAMNLQLAIEFAALAKANDRPLNRVRFAWWAAEEIGLLGSYHFVSTLVNKTYGNETIVAALNFDMMASPNGNRQVHNGSLVPVGTSETVIEKSNDITALFTDHFDSKDKPWVGVDMLGGSDYLPFILAGIPAGGLSTGASGSKTMEQRATFGGLANAALDPCYHLACDTIENLGTSLFVDNVRAAANVLWTLSHNADLMN